ncbi:MAG: hypothetical protein M3245_02260, partial [Actinomycetota bacterium]|nr:hypothetical protein [Actinomycetota bacterium]
LVSGDTNAVSDVFVRDRQEGTTERVSMTTGGAEANAHSWDPSLSADGRHVAFRSTASNLVPADTNGAPDAFVHDRITGATERVSVSSHGAEAGANADSNIPGLSADGRHVAFQSTASNLVPGDGNGAADVFVHDRATGITERVSVVSDGAEANASSLMPTISADGRHVAFPSMASNLVPGDANGAADVFVHDQGGSPGVVGTPSIVTVPGGVSVSGRAAFSGAAFTGATDRDDDGTGVGPLGAADMGAELTGVTLIIRPEQEDLVFRLDLSHLPSDPAGAGLPGNLYGVELRVGATRFEVRALRVAATSPGPPGAPHVALYRCAPDCTAHAPLTGSIGTTGNQVRVSVPLSALGAGEGTELSGLRAFTATGEAVAGVLVPRDTVPFSSSVIPAPRVELGIAPAFTPEDQVAFDVKADLLSGAFSGTIPVTRRDPGSHRVWARACLGDACGPATFGEMVP